MNAWTSHGAGSDDNREFAYRSRILTSTSGNAQIFGREVKSHLDFDKPQINGGEVHDNSNCSSSLPVLGSNDKSVEGRLAARKSRRTSRGSHDRQYLQNPKYLNYRERKRQDKGKDGEPVWPDHIEESFQNALVQIPPMGKTKRTQYGRPHGRNELIAEWIYQETGEIRSRKQVSSHIQVLGNLLKDAPEWRALTRKVDNDCKNGKDNAACDYYYESIADQVRIQRQLAQTHKAGTDGKSWLDIISQRYSLSKLTFELWVGAPENITQALHNYTRVPHSHAPLPMVPLEDFGNWRDLFPNLEATLNSTNNADFDVILVKSSFALMSDFPPKSSKLGLVLDMDFRNPGRDSIKALSELKYWSSVNHMYLSGRPFRKTEHKECQSAEFGLVKPFFEADWWASHFTKLTHRKKEAENAMDDLAQTAADENSRSLFRELSIMQEVFASSSSEQSVGLPRRRMAVLLWIFSQAGKGQTGVTSWQKLILPPSRLAANSPLAPTSSMDSSLPPLVLDSLVESSFDTTMTDHDYSLDTMETDVPLSPIVYEAGSYHSGFTPLQTMNNDHLRFYDFMGTGFTPRHVEFPPVKCEAFDFDHPIESLPYNENDKQDLGNRNQVSNIFDNLPLDEAHNEDECAPIASCPSSTAIGRPPNRSQCLANFDVSTHQMLQAQLGKAENAYKFSPVGDFEVTEQDSRRSTLANMLDLGLEQDGSNNTSATTNVSIGHDLDHEVMASMHPSIFQSPRYSRPKLLAHNSFAGVLHTASGTEGSGVEQLDFDTPTRNNFARLMADHFDDANNDDPSRQGVVGAIDIHAFSTGDSNIVRPRSQPVLPSNASPYGLPEDSVMLDDPMQSRNTENGVMME